MSRGVGVLCVLMMGAMPAFAYDDTSAGDRETTQVQGAITKAAANEEENADLLEIDDAICDIGQYDIKLDGKYGSSA